MHNENLTRILTQALSLLSHEERTYYAILVLCKLGTLTITNTHNLWTVVFTDKNKEQHIHTSNDPDKGIQYMLRLTKELYKEDIPDA